MTAFGTDTMTLRGMNTDAASATAPISGNVLVVATFGGNIGGVLVSEADEDSGNTN